MDLTQKDMVLASFLSCEEPCEEPVSPSQIEDTVSDEFDETLGNVYELLNRLQSMGYVHRVRHGEYRLTELGRKAYEQDSDDGSGMNQFTEAQIEQFERIADSDDYLDVLAGTLFSDIQGHDSAKKGLLAAAASLDDGARRQRIHVCLSGEPGTGKSTMIRRFDGVVGEYQSFGSGGATTEAGLRPSQDGSRGVLVRNNGRCVMLNEVDKTSTSDQNVLGDTMEEGEITVAMDGHDATYDAQTRVLASVNEMSGVVDHVLSRFDLVFQLEQMDIEAKQDFAESVVMSWHDGVSVSSDTVKEYIRYCRRTVSPELPPNGERGFIVDALRHSVRHGGLKDANPRHIEGAVRLSLALARLELSDTVERHHVEEAVGLLEASR